MEAQTMLTCIRCHRSFGAYDFRCPACCARLIASARPLRRLQEGHIAALRRFHGQRWPDVWAQVRKLLDGRQTETHANGQKTA